MASSIYQAISLCLAEWTSQRATYHKVHELVEPLLEMSAVTRLSGADLHTRMVPMMRIESCS